VKKTGGQEDKEKVTGRQEDRERDREAYSIRGTDGETAGV